MALTPLPTVAEQFAIHARFIGAVAAWTTNPSPGSAAHLVEGCAAAYLGPSAYNLLTQPLRYVDALITAANANQDHDLAEMVKAMRPDVVMLCARMIVRQVQGVTAEEDKLLEDLRQRKNGASAGVQP